jgi:hypothetical protein
LEHALAGSITLEEANELTALHNAFIGAHAVEVLEGRVAILEREQAENRRVPKLTIISELPALPCTDILGIPHAHGPEPPANPWNGEPKDPCGQAVRAD